MSSPQKQSQPPPCLIFRRLVPVWCADSTVPVWAESRGTPGHCCARPRACATLTSILQERRTRTRPLRKRPYRRPMLLMLGGYPPRQTLARLCRRFRTNAHAIARWYRKAKEADSSSPTAGPSRRPEARDQEARSGAYQKDLRPLPASQTVADRVFLQLAQYGIDHLGGWMPSAYWNGMLQDTCHGT